MNKEQKEIDAKLFEIEMKARDLGFVVVVFTPEELGETNKNQFESYLIEKGIEYLNITE